PDLIVMGAKGSGTFGGMLGSVAMNIVHEGRWPVLIVHQPYKGLKRVLLVIDGSAASQYTCDYMAAFPLPAGTDIEVLHVVPAVHSLYLVEPTGLALPVLTSEDEQRLRLENEVHGKEVLEHVRTQLEKNGLNVNTVLRVGNPGEQILNYVKDADIDLIVCGSRGAGNLTGWLLGSISRDIVQHAPCSVLVVRGPAETK
ncbi:MAG: universal stress protein, partial [Chloroflexi bacterium]|nr:universal stress protein [Chloroflexota bacterium]